MRRFVRELRMAVVVLSALLLAADVLAQGGSTAQISGTVKDESGGVLPGADVTATQTDTGVMRSVVTDADGSYVLSNLPLDPYRLEVKLWDVRSYSRTGIVLQVNAQPVIDVQLALGDLNETVSVVGAAPLVETRSPTLGQVIENKPPLPESFSRSVSRSSRLRSARIPEAVWYRMSRSFSRARLIMSSILLRWKWAGARPCRTKSRRARAALQ